MDLIDDEIKQVLKMNAIALVRDHREHCKLEHMDKGRACGISLYLIALLLQRAGISIEKEEFKEFL